MRTHHYYKSKRFALFLALFKYRNSCIRDTPVMCHRQREVYIIEWNLYSFSQY